MLVMGMEAALRIVPTNAIENIIRAERRTEAEQCRVNTVGYCRRGEPLTPECFGLDIYVPN